VDCFPWQHQHGNRDNPYLFLASAHAVSEMMAISAAGLGGSTEFEVVEGAGEAVK
jgi:hypothetical protein